MSPATSGLWVEARVTLVPRLGDTHVVPALLDSRGVALGRAGIPTDSGPVHAGMCPKLLRQITRKNREGVMQTMKRPARTCVSDWSKSLLGLSLCVALTACGGDDNGDTPTAPASSVPPVAGGPAPEAPVAKYSVTGTISGLVSGTQMTLLNRGGDALTVNGNGTFGFSTSMASGSEYAVGVATQPKGQTCTVSNGSGTIAASNVTSIGVTCTRIVLVYVTNAGSSAVSQYTIGEGGTLTPISPASVGAVSTPYSVSVDPSGKYAYVAGWGGVVSQYTIGASGALTPMTPANVTAGPQSQAVIVDPSGKYAYAANVGDSTISQYTIGVNGALTPMPTAKFNAGSNPSSIAVDPTGKYAYVTSFNNNTILQYTIGADGALTPMATAGVLTGPFPYSVTVSPSGKYAYVTSMGGSGVFQFTIGADGALTSMTTASVGAGLSPTSVTVDPSGKYAYVVNQTDNTVSQYTIGADGGLSPMATASVATGIVPNAITVDPTGKYAYVTNYTSNTVSQFKIGADGALTPMTSAFVSTGNGPIAIVTTYAATN
ncbi:beta-propeller fold lactonase family protein [Cupriavidus sp. SW-Y-13]|nr:beta-propeller fold lactonase family protein [Cupriavidus sp. SW-Y-13]